MNAPEPTQSLIGSVERIRVYRQRVANGQPVFCADDKPDYEPIRTGTRKRKAATAARFPYKPTSKRTQP